MKIVLVGAGSYVFSPTVLHDLIETYRANCELALVDTQPESAQRMARVAAALARKNGVTLTTSVAADWKDALDGADAVLLSAAIQGRKRWETDFALLSECGLADQARECGGIGGLIYALRTCTLALGLCADMRAQCPGAPLLVASNPLPRVITATQRFGGIRSYGFCSAGAGQHDDFAEIAAMLGRPPETVRAVAAGLNHFSWLVRLTDAQTGADLLPEALARVADGALGDDRRRMLLDYGGVCTLPAGHSADFVAKVEGWTREIHVPFHGDGAERAAQIAALDAVADGKGDFEAILARSSWEHPALAAATLIGGGEFAVASVNVLNEGNIVGLPDGSAVEVPVLFADHRAEPVRDIALPEGVLAICKKVSRVHDLAAEAAATGDRALLWEALTVDPALELCDPAVAKRAMERLLDAHRDVLPQFFK